jgi:hypothetical protein
MEEVGAEKMKFTLVGGYEGEYSSMHIQFYWIFFLDDPGGLGKTFVYNMLLASVRRDEHIAMGVAFSGITTLLLEDGRTSHSVFKIPIAIGRDLMC